MASSCSTKLSVASAGFLHTLSARGADFRAVLQTSRRSLYVLSNFKRSLVLHSTVTILVSCSSQTAVIGSMLQAFNCSLETINAHMMTIAATEEGWSFSRDTTAAQDGLDRLLQPSGCIQTLNHAFQQLAFASDVTLTTCPDLSSGDAMPTVHSRGDRVAFAWLEDFKYFLLLVGKHLPRMEDTTGQRDGQW